MKGTYVADIQHGTANAYGLYEGCYYENHPILSDHGISTRISTSGSRYWLCGVSRVGGLRCEHRNQHALESVPDHIRFRAIGCSKGIGSRQ
jgi:hypothetical protein